MGPIKLKLSVAAKLAIASVLGMMLLGCMIYQQIIGSGGMRESQAAAARQLTLAQVAADAKASIRGMGVGLRDILLAGTASELREATKSITSSDNALKRSLAELKPIALSQDNKMRVDRLEELRKSFVTSVEQIASMRGEVFNNEDLSVVSSGVLPIDSARTSALKKEIVRLRRDVIVPIAVSLEVTSEELTTVGKESGAKLVAAAAEQSISVEQTSLMLGVGNLLLLVVTTFFSFFTIGRPMRALSRAMRELAGGNFGVMLPGLGRKDEIGDVASAVEEFKIKAQERAMLEAEAQRDQEHRVAEQRKQEMHRLASSFEAAVGQIVETVSSASFELESSATTLTATAEESQKLTALVASASEHASCNVQSVASAAEQMSSSVNEISRQVQDSARIANEAVGHARRTNDRVDELAKAATRIGDVVELINTIAGQTNLLALNATIEAARAGEAGRGFAVVASEVKTLAEQTAKATGEISQQIIGIQTATQESVGAIKNIGDIIEKMSDIASTIAAAVEEQGAATLEISRNAQQAAEGTTQVSSSVADVQRGAGETGSASTQVLSAARLLSQDSNRLRVEVEKFLNTVRAA